MKKLWVAVLAGIMLAGLVCASAFADVLENIVVSNITYYSSGCLKGFTMSYDVLEWNLEAADARVSVQTEEFSNNVDNYPYGDFRDNGRYADKHNYPDWPSVPENCGFVTWNSEGTFRRPETGGSGNLDISFADGKVDCNKGQTYYLYVWANYGIVKKNTYPDAYVMQFQTGTGNGGITVGGGATVQNPGNQNPGNQNPGNQDPGNQDPGKQSPVNMPRTGDRSALALWMTLGLLAGCGMLVLARRGENNG